MQSHQEVIVSELLNYFNMSRRTSNGVINYAESDDEEEEFDPESPQVSSKKSRKSSGEVPSAKRLKKESVNYSTPSDESSDNEEEEEEVDGYEESPEIKKKKIKNDKKKTTKTKTKTKKTIKKKTVTKTTTTTKVKKEVIVKIPKSLSQLERLDEARRAYKWWEAEELPDGLNWRKLEHPGVLFPPPYTRHDVPLLYDGNPIELNDEQEEICTFYASMPDDGPQLGNEKTRKVFQTNFMNDFKSLLPTGHVIKKFDKCDFSLIKKHLDKQKSLKKAASQDEKAQNKAIKDEQMLKYGYALIDGRVEKMGNFNMEPPGLFRGRGEHPRTGALKKRCFPESVDINVSLDSCVPPCSMPGHAWQSVRHDPLVTWLCGWNENVQQQHKYVMLAASSSFKGKSDMEKYEKAIRLKSCIDKVRKDYTAKIKSKDSESRQLGTAMWVIDVLALRVGGEKGEDEADTVGCCTLRKEHLTFSDSPDAYEIEVKFLGKDSMLFQQTINFATYGDIGKLVYRNLKSFCKGKSKTSDVFDTLNPSILNKHLTSIMPGLTAKVFRTFNASVTLEKELPTEESMKNMTIQEKIVKYNAANREVAILCNHQKTVSKATEVMFENLNEKLDTLNSQLRDLVKWLDLAKKKKSDKIPLKKDDTKLVEKVTNALKNAQARKEKAKTDEEKLAAAAEFERAKAEQKEDMKRRFRQKHMYKQVPTAHALEAKMEKWGNDIRKLETDIRNRDENKEVALGTSKINYMDPRISVAWCKRNEVPVDKVFAKTLREKFNWSCAVTSDWKFEHTS